MLRMIARQYDLKDGVAAARQTGEGRNDADPIILVHAVEFAYRTFREGFSGVQRSFEHAFAMGRHQQIRLGAADHVQRFA